MGSGPLLSSFEILECPTDTVLTAQILHNFTRLFRVASPFENFGKAALPACAAAGMY